MSVARRASQLLVPSTYSDRPVAWVEDRLHEHVWSKQREILESVRDNRRTAVRSCHSAGKSHIASRVCGWWIDSHAPGEAFVVTTAPTFNQVRAILWRYIGQMHRKNKLPGHVNQTEWSFDGELVAFGRKPSDYDESAFQGIHAPKVLVILDEACGIPDQLWVAADTLTTTPGCRILAIGNPDNPVTEFKRVCDPVTSWHVISIPAASTPNFTDEQCPDHVKDQLVSVDWVEEKRFEWGEDSPLWTSKVLAQFPTDAPNAVVRVSDLEACRLVITDQVDARAEVHLGVDVGGGGDETVIRERRGPVCGREWTSRSDRPETIAPLVLRCIKETGATIVKIDSIGIGAGLVGELRNANLPDVLFVPVNVSQRASQPTKFANRRAEMWWMARINCEQGLWDLSVVDDKMAAQLTAPRYEIDASGRIKIESKDDIRERLRRSPDNADALLLAYYTPGAQATADMATFMRLRSTNVRRLEAEANPPEPDHITGPGAELKAWMTARKGAGQRQPRGPQLLPASTEQPEPQASKGL